MNLTFVIVMAAVTYGAFKLGHRLIAVGIGAASACALVPELPQMAQRTLATTAGIPAVSQALGAGITLAVPIVALLVMFGARPRGRRR